MYFNNFPNIYYQFDIKGKPVLTVVKDITTNVRLRKEILNNITLFDWYDIKDGDTPEIIAAKYYGNPQYHWVVMLCNDKFNWVDDFPLEERTLNRVIEAKYEDPYAIHHYETDDGLIVSSRTPGAMPITNYQHEYNLNESKRQIRLIAPSLLGKILTNFKAIL